MNVQPIKAQSNILGQYKKFAVFVVLALVVIIIFESILVALVVTNDKDNTEAMLNDNECERNKKENSAIPMVEGYLNISEVMHKNCRDIQEKNPAATSGLYLIRAVGKNHRYMYHL